MNEIVCPAQRSPLNKYWGCCVCARPWNNIIFHLLYIFSGFSLNIFWISFRLSGLKKIVFWKIFGIDNFYDWIWKGTGCYTKIVQVVSSCLFKIKKLKIQFHLKISSILIMLNCVGSFKAILELLWNLNHNRQTPSTTKSLELLVRFHFLPCFDYKLNWKSSIFYCG